MEPCITGIVDIHADDGGFDLAQFTMTGGVALIHKLTEGRDFNDRDTARAMLEAEQCGLLRGLYHFGNGTDPVHQADHFLDRALPYPDALLVLDCESNGRSSFGTMTADSARKFVVRVHEITGRWPVFYSFTSFLHGLRLPPGDELGNCPLWQAQFGERPVGPGSLAWSSIDLWQYTNGRVGPSDVRKYPRSTRGFHRPSQDRSVFFGNVGELAAWWDSAGR